MRRVVIIGKNRLAAACLATVLETGDEVVRAVADPADDGTDGWQPSFRAASENAGVSVDAPANVNDEAFVASIRSVMPDFLLSFQAAQILRRPLIETAAVAALNLHFGPLPRYRGVAPIAWAIINGEASTGVTIHHIDPGVDSGAIVRASAVPIAPTDTGRSLYDKCTDAGIDLFRVAWPQIRDVPPVGSPQDDAGALYYNRHSVDFSRRTIEWSRDAKAIADWVRAMIFPPFQHPEVFLPGTRLEVRGVTWDRGLHSGRPGQILANGDASLTVAAPGGRVTLLALWHDGRPVDAEWLERSGFVPGALLGAG
jgi:methionyl-tRNA formyltransferase